MRTNGGERAYEVDTTGLIHLCGDSMALLSKARQRGRPPESRRATPAVERALERKRKPSPTAHGPSPRKGRQDVSRRDGGEGRRDSKYQLGLCILTSPEGMWSTNLGGPSLRNRFRFEGSRVCTKGRGRPPPAHSRACKHAYGPKRHAAAFFDALPTLAGRIEDVDEGGEGWHPTRATSPRLNPCAIPESLSFDRRRLAQLQCASHTAGFETRARRAT